MLPLHGLWHFWLWLIVLTPHRIIGNDGIQETDTWSLIWTQLFLADWHTVFFLFLCECSWDHPVQSLLYCTVDTTVFNALKQTFISTCSSLVIIHRFEQMHWSRHFSFCVWQPCVAVQNMASHLSPYCHCWNATPTASAVWPSISVSAWINECEGGAVCSTWKHQNPHLCFEWPWFEEVGRSIFRKGFLEMDDLRKQIYHIF